MDIITIDFLRHGQTIKQGCLLGQTDAVLSEAGWQQMDGLMTSVQIPWQKVISSPLQRCLNVATPLSVQHGVPLVIESDWQEMYFGDWDGKLLAELYASDQSDEVIAFFNDPSRRRPPNGESFAEFELRVQQAWERLFESLVTEQLHHVLVITHGGVIKVILKQILGIATDRLTQLAVANAAVTRVEHHSDYPARLIFHGNKITDARQLAV